MKSLSMKSIPVTAGVRISKYIKYKTDANCNDYDSCTESKCIKYNCYREGVYSYVQVSCDFCRTNITMNTLTNKYTDFLSWEKRRINNN